MQTISKRCLLTLLILIGYYPITKADFDQDQKDFLFSPADTVLSEDLDNERGREGVDMTTLNNMNVRATLSGNEANNNVTGFNIIDHGAFTEASGIISVIQNTGNNVIIQDSTIVNVTIIP
jgi:hypothetical protein